MAQDRASQILSSMAAVDADGTEIPNCFSIGSVTNAQVTIVSQQRRSLNLVWALNSRRRVEGKSIAVVGGGIAGITAALAARKVGAARVDIFDAYEEPVTPQRLSTQRFLHPSLFEWPAGNWREENACLPLNNWSAGRAWNVRAQIVSGFLAEARQIERIRLLPQRQVMNVSAVTDGVELKVIPFNAIAASVRQNLEAKNDAAYFNVAYEKPRFDMAILCEGFLPEPRWEKSISGSYWRDSKANWPNDDKTTIVGDGDGALTELFERVLLGYGPTTNSSRWHQEQLADIAVRISEEDRIATLDLEDRFRLGHDNGSVLDLLPAATLSLLAEINMRIRDTQVQVLGKFGSSVLRPSSFLLNRAIAALTTLDGNVKITPSPRRITSPVEAMREFPGSKVIWRTGASRPETFGLEALASPTLDVRASLESETNATGHPRYVVQDALSFSSTKFYGDESFGAPLAKAAFEGDLRIALEGLSRRSSISMDPSDLIPVPDPPIQMDHGGRTSSQDLIFSISDALFRFAKAVGPDNLWWAANGGHELAISLDLVALACDLPPVTVAVLVARAHPRTLLYRRLGLEPVFVDPRASEPRVWLLEYEEMESRKLDLSAAELADLAALVGSASTPDKIEHWFGVPPAPTGHDAKLSKVTSNQDVDGDTLLVRLSDVGFENTFEIAEGLLRSPDPDPGLLVEVLLDAPDRVALDIAANTLTSQSSPSVRPTLAVFADRLLSSAFEREMRAPAESIDWWTFTKFRLDRWFDFQDTNWRQLMALGLGSAALGRLEAVRPGQPMASDSGSTYLDEDPGPLDMASELLGPLVRTFEVADATASLEGSNLWSTASESFERIFEDSDDRPKAFLELIDLRFIGLKFVFPIRERREDLVYA